jgi:hypothetical protein
MDFLEIWYWRLTNVCSSTAGKRALCMLDNYGDKHTVRICNTYCFCTGTVVTGTLLSVTLYVHCLPCYIVDSCNKISNNTKETHCWVSVAPIFTRTSHNIAICVRCLSSLEWCHYWTALPADVYCSIVWHSFV